MEATIAAHKKAYSIQSDFWALIFQALCMGSTSARRLCDFPLSLLEPWDMPSQKASSRPTPSTMSLPCWHLCLLMHKTVCKQTVGELRSWRHCLILHPQCSPACFSEAESLPWCRDPGRWYNLSLSAWVLQWFSPSWPSCICWLVLHPPAVKWQGLRTPAVGPFFLFKRGRYVRSIAIPCAHPSCTAQPWWDVIGACWKLPNHSGKQEKKHKKWQAEIIPRVVPSLKVDTGSLKETVQLAARG